MELIDTVLLVLSSGLACVNLVRVLTTLISSLVESLYSSMPVKDLSIYLIVKTLI